MAVLFGHLIVGQPGIPNRCNNRSHLDHRSHVVDQCVSAGHAARDYALLSRFARAYQRHLRPVIRPMVAQHGTNFHRGFNLLLARVMGVHCPRALQPLFLPWAQTTAAIQNTTDGGTTSNAFLPQAERRNGMPTITPMCSTA
jgi:hypothetical protein